MELDSEGKMAKKPAMRQKKYKVWKIPGRVGAVPDRLWGTKDFDKLRPYLNELYAEVVLPPATSARFAKSFQLKAKCFPDKKIADKWIWCESRVFIICSQGLPSWIVEEIQA
jgi:hypothetical protein